jgi:hypothetical protein
MAQPIASTIPSTNLDNVVDMKNMISNLPEDVLLYVLSLLSTKDGGTFVLIHLSLMTKTRSRKIASLFY